MSALGERTLLLHLIKTDSIETLAAEGLPEECIPSEKMRPIVAWAIDYYYRSGCKQAPSEVALRSIAVKGVTFGDLLDDHEVPLGEDSDDTIEWAIEDLKATYVHRMVTGFNKRLATDMAAAEARDRVGVVGNYATELVGLSVSMEPRDSNIDLRQGGPLRLVEYEGRAATRGEHRGMHFGLPLIDGHTFGIHDGELATWAAPPKTGKAQPLTSRVLTPTGWVTMGSLRVGDDVVGSNGRGTVVMAVYPQGSVPIYRITMSDGSSVEACGDHLWRVRQPGAGWRVQTTTQIRDDLLAGRRRAHQIPMVKPVEFVESAPLPLDPYLLGALLGDGGMTQATPTFTTADDEILSEVIRLLPGGVEATPRGRYTWGLSGGRKGRANPLTTILRQLELAGHRGDSKFIPSIYMMASVEDRFALLQGLLDTDGCVEGRRSITYSTCSEQLADDIIEVVESLGGVCRRRVKPIEGHLAAHRLAIRLPDELGAPFRLSRKALRAAAPSSRARTPRRDIVAVDYVGMMDAQCITVSAADHCYVTEHSIVTHNSYMLAWVALQEWMRGRTVCLFTLENSVQMTLDRIACLACGVNSDAWQRGECTAEEVNDVRGWLVDVEKSDTPLWVLQPDLGKRSVLHMVRDAQLREADSLIIDQLTFIEHDQKIRARDQQIAKSLHMLKGLISTGHHRMPCLLAHQINREGVKAAEKIGHLEMYHLAEAADVERTSDWVFGQYASQDDLRSLRCKVQTLACRRAALRHWELDWAVQVGTIRVRNEITI